MSFHGLQMPKKKGFVLGSWEQNHILRNPPSSIHTRKKERVDFADVKWMLNDQSRINESISYLARGTNPMVDVNYNLNTISGGSHTNSLPNIQSSNPYKVSNVRPPMFTQEDLLPLSRMRRKETIGITNPGLPGGFNDTNLMEKTDKGEIKSAIDKTKINYIDIHPTATYKFELPQEVFTSNAINHNTLNISATSGIRLNKDDTNRINATNPFEASKVPVLTTASTNISNSMYSGERNELNVESFIKDNIILENISPNFSILVYNTNNKNYSEVFASIKDKTNIAVQSSFNLPINLSREDGTPIKIKDYRWQIVHSAVGRDNLVLQIQDSPDIQLDRNLPLYTVGSNASGNTKVERFHSSEPITNDKINTSASSSISMKYGRNDAIHDVERNIKLRGMGSVGSSIENFGSVPSLSEHNIPTLTNRNLSAKQIAALELANRFENY